MLFYGDNSKIEDGKAAQRDRSALSVEFFMLMARRFGGPE